MADVTINADVHLLFTTQAAFPGLNPGKKYRTKAYDPTLKLLMLKSAAADTIEAEWSADVKQCLLATEQSLLAKKTFTEGLAVSTSKKILLGASEGGEISSDNTDVTIANSQGDIILNANSGLYLKIDNVTALDVSSSGAVTAAVSLKAPVVRLVETTTPSAVSGIGALYTKTDDKLYFQNGAGVERGMLPEIKGSFTMGVTGFATAPTDTAYYSIVGNVVTLRLPRFQATSNASTFTLTGLPSAIQTVLGSATMIPVIDNGVHSWGTAFLSTASPGVVVVSFEGSASGWTTSGTKGLSLECSMIFHLDAY